MGMQQATAYIVGIILPQSPSLHSYYCQSLQRQRRIFPRDVVPDYPLMIVPARLLTSNCRLR